MTINRVQVIWSGTLIEGGGLSTFYFDADVGTPAQHVAAVETFLDATESQRSTLTAWATSGDVAQLDEATGTLEGVTAVTPATGTGATSGDVLPPTNQGLLRCITSIVTGGRVLRGRLFLPGAVEESNGAGIPGSAYLTAYNNAAAALIAEANAPWVIWSRTHGVTSEVITATMWTKWGSLRSRRD